MNATQALATTMAIGALLAGTPALAGTSSPHTAISLDAKSVGGTHSGQSRSLIGALKHIDYRPGLGRSGSRWSNGNWNKGRGQNWGHAWGHNWGSGPGDPYKSNGT